MTSEPFSRQKEINPEKNMCFIMEAISQEAGAAASKNIFGQEEAE